ncbi:NAD(P)/FAD-dependent oxidoreductase [Rhizobium halophilum]|uniref:NAD(P)/FAD-dependent oxidoreductase n=1 Tax=Rhizobium halophilum TaxID=2846852 RepID=UPI001EFE23BC|nr:NAD(P)/FAD-dependent oxidoreductase [Rhizobium halophilum]MCF6369096.1 NAD(P)/FAD-dependent oxidoreductase [Rhizobium halophilum]
MEDVDCVVVGAGVVGLAMARALALSGREVLILEAEGAIGTGTSSRNSEVIHAGIYYPAGSLMAELCVAGKQQLYRYCAERGLPHRNCGKLIVATSAQELDVLPAIAARAAANGVGDLRQISADEALDLEPALAATGALLSPSTGIIDSHALMTSLLGDAESAGALIAFRSPILAGRVTEAGIEIEVGGEEPMTLRARTLVNAAGHGAPALARSLHGMPQDQVPQAYFAKGSYFSMTGRTPFSRLIYPVPVKGGLGIHLTLDLAGQARFGPDVEWVDGLDYEVDPARAESFYRGIRRYYPGLPDGSLIPAYSGIRPKIVPPEVASQDFVIQGPKTHGVPGLVNLFGIESPGLTACLAIADHVASMVDAD